MSTAVDPGRCVEMVWHQQGNWGRRLQCKRKPLAGGKHCSTHEPKAVNARRAESAARWRERFQHEREQRERAEAAELALQERPALLERLAQETARADAATARANAAEARLAQDMPPIGFLESKAAVIAKLRMHGYIEAADRLEKQWGQS